MKDKNHYKEKGITKKLFLEWRSPRFGTENPTVMNNKIWEFLILSEDSSYSINEDLKGPSSLEKGPMWSFERFGMSKTQLPDGRIIHIAGEHEDYYDPDFNIYNDVIVKNTDGTINIYCYPEDIFNPTDFHSATLVDNEIILIGSLGYVEKRKPKETQIYILNIDDFKIKKIESTGNNPGWIHSHNAALSDDKQHIFISAGELFISEDDHLLENIDEWKVNINNWSWERLSEKKWIRWNALREDEEMNQIWEMRQVKINEELGIDMKSTMADALKESGTDPDLIAEMLNDMDEDEVECSESDLKILEELFSPPIPHKRLPSDEDNEDEYNVYKIEVKNTIVRYTEETSHIQVTIEGELDENTVLTLKEDLVNKLTELEKVKYKNVEY